MSMARRTVPTARPVCAVSVVIEGQLGGDLAALDLLAQPGGELPVRVHGRMGVNVHGR